MRLRRLLIYGVGVASALLFVSALRFVVSQVPRLTPPPPLPWPRMSRKALQPPPPLPFDPSKVHRTPRPTTTTSTTTTSNTTTTPPPKKEPAMPLEKESKEEEKVEAKGNPAVHAFYYPWYGSPEFDNGSFLHWNHPYLPHWNKAEALKWPMGVHKPPDDIGANFFPQLGPYSSRDLSVIDQHMQWIVQAGIGVVAVSWYPAGKADEQGRPWEDLMPILLDSALKHGLKMTFHLEPYKDRSANSVKEDLEYISSKYGSHLALYKHEHMGETRPLVYVYDSYLLPPDEWRSILHPQGVMTIRGSKADAFVVGLLVKEKERTELVKAGFDGLYTYFAAEGFTYGSTQHNWASLNAFARKNKLIFCPSVGPGYIDIRVRPWNKANVRPRHNGTYYTAAWDSAIASRAPLVSITSFNEWHEGTQIEPAAPKQIDAGFRYQDYGPMQADFYLKLTKDLIAKFAAQEKKAST